MTLSLASERAASKLAWLDVKHSFQFDEERPEELNGFRALKAFNDVRMAPGSAFPMRRLKNMELLSYVVEGELRLQDSQGHSQALSTNDVQRLSSGLGLAHAELNNSKAAPLRFIQLWIQPSVPDLKPGYEQMSFSKAEKTGKLKLIASGDREEDCLFIHQDVHIYAASLSDGDAVSHIIAPNRNVWLQVVSGMAKADGMELSEGDALAIENEETSLAIEAASRCEIILLDLC